MATKVFVSYDHSEDAHYKRLLQAWDANSNFDFEFDSRGPDVAINSSDASVIKGRLTYLLGTATHLLVIVGARSHTSRWMEWEIEKAKELRLRLVAVKIESANISPAGLLGAGTSWATSFTRERIIAALDNAGTR